MSSKAGDGKATTSEQEDASDQQPPPKRICFAVEDFSDLNKDQLAEKWKDVEKYVAYLEETRKDNTSNDESGKVNEERSKTAQQDSTPRENVLVMRLATKEQEIQELLAQINELKHSQNPATSQLRSTLLDPAVNILFERMKTELTESKEKLEQAQNDLSAWKFTPDSVTGKKLMAKCRMLIQENQDLGKQLSQGRLAQLEAELALQKKYSGELKGSQDELNEFVIQLDEEVEGMQSTICVLQQQLKDCKAQLQKKTEEVESLNLQLNKQTIETSNNRNSGKPKAACSDCTVEPDEHRTNFVDSEHSVTVDDSRTSLNELNETEPHQQSCDSVDATDLERQWDAMTESHSRTISVIQHGVDAKSETPSPPKGNKTKTSVPVVDQVSEREPNHKLRTKETMHPDSQTNLDGDERTEEGDSLSDCNGEVIAVGDR